jgi:glycogen debranching enzyme
LIDEREWLEADELGGFAMGTVSLIRTRRYHGLLTTATRPPVGRVVLVAGLEVWLERAGDETVALSSQRYAPDVIHPDGHTRIESFAGEPWPTWTLRLPGGASVEHAISMHRPSGQVSLTWRLEGGRATLVVRPLLAARDYHALTRENGAFSFDAEVVGGNVSWQPQPERPAVTALSTGRYHHDPMWYRQFAYREEERRGLDFIEDLASPGLFRFELSAVADAAMVLRAGRAPWGQARSIARDHRAAERARRGDPVERAVDAYLVERDGGLTVVAGYPWFTDWGRDTFIALRGLCMLPDRPPRRFEQARQVLGAWARAAIGGMVPNRFVDADEPGAEPEYNAVDASLWFVVAAGELLAAAEVPAAERRRLEGAIAAILAAYAAGTRYRIGCAADGLIAAGEPGVQLTWMDAKVEGHVVTPRIGKPVEVQALWINALAVGERFDPEWAALRGRATASFLARFPRSDGSLFDVVDADHVAGADDASFRPNQIFAVGGLPLALLEGAAARAVVDAVERRLWTPLGLRTLDPDDPAYRGRYRGGVWDRDGAYHQGTVWPWLAAPFIEAWLRVRGDSAAARAEARRRFLAPLEGQLEVAGLGHISEIADGDAPHHPAGAPFQAWSLAALLTSRYLTRQESE